MEVDIWSDDKLVQDLGDETRTFSDQISGSRKDFYDRLQRFYELAGLGNQLVTEAEVYDLGPVWFELILSL